MPGLFGFFGNDKKLASELHYQFKNKFNEIKQVELDKGRVVLGSHIHDKLKDIGRQRSSYYVVDGEYSIYDMLNSTENNNIVPFEINKDRISFPNGCSGNILIYNQRSSKVFVFKGESSCFPIYYTLSNENFLVSSHITAIPKSVKSNEDPVGINQYLVHGFCIGSRTQFKKIKKLCPGQLLIYSIDEKEYKIIETSELWSDDHDNVKEKQMEDIVEILSQTLDDSCQRYLNDTKIKKYGLMLSAGWDSRLVLSSILKNGLQSNCVCISYENSIKRSRELNIVNDIAAGHRLSLQNEKALINTYTYEKLNEVFSKTETCCFPEWYFIGEKMKALGVGVTTCGILGEVVGGQYSVAKISNRFRQGIDYLLSYLPIQNKELSVDEATAYLIKYYSKSPWYIDKSYKEDYNVLECAADDICDEVKRLQQRGVNTGNSLIEAFITEHRGMGHIAEQSRAIRASVDLFLPLADREFLKLASILPNSFKLQNKMTRSVIKENFVSLLNYPTSAILVPAKFPLLIQEISRVYRFLIDRKDSFLFIKSKGTKSPSVTQYRDAEYLRDSFFLDGLLNNTSLEYIKKDQLINLIEDTRQYKNSTPSWFIYWQIMKILSIDLLVS